MELAITSTEATSRITIRLMLWEGIEPWVNMMTPFQQINEAWLKNRYVLFPFHWKNKVNMTHAILHNRWNTMGIQLKYDKQFSNIQGNGLRERKRLWGSKTTQ